MLFFHLIEFVCHQKVPKQMVGTCRCFEACEMKNIDEGGGEIAEINNWSSILISITVFKSPTECLRQTLKVCHFLFL